MRINEHTAIATSKVLLVPYLAQHVSKYHNWMQDPDIQAATASEPLTVDEEDAMQKSWRWDADKLTFIVYETGGGHELEQKTNAGKLREEGMIGDVNLFITLEDADDGAKEGSLEQIVVGEVELMIAEKAYQGQGFGRAALLAFLMYVLQNQKRMVQEFLASLSREADKSSVYGEFNYLRVKVGWDNERSLKLFESIGFLRTGEKANYFGEFELRRYGLDLNSIERCMAEKGVNDWKEIVLQRNEIACP